MFCQTKISFNSVYAKNWVFEGYGAYTQIFLGLIIVFFVTTF